MNPQKQCCDKSESSTPDAIGNPPGLTRLDYRVGTHPTFLASMKGQLSGHAVHVEAPATQNQPATPSQSVVDLLKVCQWLRQPKPLNRYLARRLEQRNATLSKSIDGVARGDASTTELANVKADLEAILPSLCEELDLYNQPWFQSEWLTTEVSSLLRSDLDQTQHARLNRAVVGHQCPGIAADRDPTIRYPLRALTTRESSDPAIAFLDGWATVADVLTFYQERIANEGFLRTATERRSILELANLVDYQLRPGVSASTLLAFTLDDGYRLEIPAGTPAKSTPLPGETQQTFETAEPLQARAEWNELKPRMTLVQKVTVQSVSNIRHVQVDGITSNVKPNDRLLFTFGLNEQQRAVRVVERVEAIPEKGRTVIHLQATALSLEEYVRVFNLHVGRYRTSIDSNPGLQQSKTSNLLNALLKKIEAEIQTQGSVETLDRTVQEHFNSLVTNTPTDALQIVMTKLEEFSSDSGGGLGEVINAGITKYRADGAPLLLTARGYRRQDELIRRIRSQLKDWGFLAFDPTRLTKAQWRDSAHAKLDSLKAMIQGNNAPTIFATDGKVAYRQGALTTKIDPGLQIFDDSNLKTARVAIESPNSNDKITLEDNSAGFTIDATNNGEAGILEFSGDKSVADFLNALRSVTYRDASGTLAPGDYDVTFTITDANDVQASATRTIEVIAATTGTLSTTSEPLSFIEGSGPISIDRGLRFTSSTVSITTATVTISTGIEAGDVLDFTAPPGSGITGSFTSPTLTLTGAATVNQYQSALRSVRFDQPSNDPTSVTREITFTVDGNSATRDIEFVPRDDAPVVSATNPSPYTAGDTAIVLDSSLTLVDPDTSKFKGATVKIVSGLQSGEDLLGFAEGTFSEIDGQYFESLGVLVLNQASVNVAPNIALDRLESLLRSVTFATKSSGALTGSRVIEISVSDGVGSATATLTLEVEPTATTSPTDFVQMTPRPVINVEESGQQSIDEGLVFSGAGTRPVQQAIVKITPSSDEDRLNFTATGGIDVDSSTPGTLTFTTPSGSSIDLDTYRTALRTVTYENQATIPKIGTRNVSISVTLVDGTTGQGNRRIDVVLKPESSSLLTSVMNSFFAGLEELVNEYPIGRRPPATPSKEKYRDSLVEMISYFESLFESIDAAVSPDTSELVEGLEDSLLPETPSGDALLWQRLEKAENLLDDLDQQRTRAVGDTPLPNWNANEFASRLAFEIENNVGEIKAGRPTTTRHEAMILVGRIVEFAELLSGGGLAQLPRLVLESMMSPLEDVPRVDPPPIPPSDVLTEIRSGAQADLALPTTTIHPFAKQARDLQGTLDRAKLISDPLLSSLRSLATDLKDHAEDFREKYGKQLIEIVDRYGFIAGLEDSASSPPKASEILSTLKSEVAGLSEEEPLQNYVEKIDEALDEFKRINKVSGDLAQLISTITGELEVVKATVHNPITLGSQDGPAQVGLSELLDLTLLTRRLAAAGSNAAQNLTQIFQSDPSNLKTPFIADVVARLRRSLTSDTELDPFEVWRGTQFKPQDAPRLYVMRNRPAIFGYNAQKETKYITDDSGAIVPPPTVKLPQSSLDDLNPATDERPNKVFLDGEHDGVVPNGYMILEKRESLLPDVFLVAGVRISPRTAYGISGKTTEVAFGEGKTWWDPILPTQGEASPAEGTDEKITKIRTTVVYSVSEELQLADIDITSPIGRQSTSTANSTSDEFRERPNEIELADLHDGLDTGRTLIITGERLDVPGVQVTETARISAVSQILRKVSGERPRTRLMLDKPQLDFEYKRDTVKIYGNVIRATHGETQHEVLGHGDATLDLQRFQLSKSPLTHVPAPTPSGIASSLELRVNGAVWPEAERLSELGSNDRGYVTGTDNDDKTTVTTGNGYYGARLPTGIENVRAKYRSGIGRAGNVRAGQIDILGEKPLGLQKVINPVRATGGADRESRDQARENVPLALMALDRLVSVRDYADFARSFAGIGKSAAVLLSDGARRVVHVTIAGADGIPIDESSDLFRNLKRAFVRLGDPDQKVALQVAQHKALVLNARVRIDERFHWDTVEPQVRSELRKQFGFDRSQLGKDVQLSQVISVIQRVRGVAYVDVESFAGLDREIATDNAELQKFASQLGMPSSLVAVRMAHSTNRGMSAASTGAEPMFRPAQYATFPSDIEGTLVLSEIPS